MNAGEHNEMASVMHWLSLGHGEDYAISTAVLEDSLVGGIANLKRATQPLMIDITGGALLPEALMMHDPLLALWKRFAEALSKPRGGEAPSIDLHITHSSLTEEVIKILEPALKAAPLDYLMLSNNRLGPEGIKCVARVLRANPRVRYLVLAKNEIQDRDDFLSVVRAARKHPTLEHFNLEGCGIGPKLMTVPHCVPQLLSLHTVNLAHNDLSSSGAAVIAAGLVANPAIKILVLDENGFSDADASLFATSLESNEHLVQLDLCGNNFTRAGVKALLNVTFNDCSLNALQDSNHTCRVKLFADDSAVSSSYDEEVLSINGKMFRLDVFPEEFRPRCSAAARENLNKLAELMLVRARTRVKMLHAFWRGSGAGDGNMKFLTELPVELMPMALAVFQDCGRYAGTKERNLATVFAVVRSSPGVMSFGGAGSQKRETHASTEKESSLLAPRRKYTSRRRGCLSKYFSTALKRIQRKSSK